MANRADRRKAAKATPRWLPKSQEEAMKALIKNGITPEYVDREKNKSFQEGFMRAGQEIVRGCYAAVCLALNEEFGFGYVRCKRVLQSVDSRLGTTLTSQELIDETLERMGITIVFSEGVNRVQ